MSDKNICSAKSAQLNTASRPKDFAIEAY